MYIDSPEFKKRKILRDNNNPASGFGIERLQLANHVVDELNNNHRNDAAILEKFRKQAEQYKRNLLRQKHQPPQISSQTLLKSESFPTAFQQQPPKSPSLASNPNPNKNTDMIPTSISRIYDQQRQEILQKQPQVIVREIVKVSDEGNKNLIRIIQRKDKELSKQAKIIRRNQEKINDLRKRLENLEYANRIRQADRLAALEQGSYEKIKGFISSLSNKLAENHELLQQNLSDLKHIKKNSLSYSPSHFPQKQPYSPPIKKHKNNSKLLLPLASSQPNPQPKISYNYKVSSDRLINQQKYGLNSMIDNLSTSRNRLDALGSYY